MSKSSSDPPPDADLARLLLGATRAFEREMLARLAQAGLDTLSHELEREHVQLLGPTRTAALKQDLRSLSEIGTRDSFGAAS